MSTINTCAQTTTPLHNGCRDDGVVQQSPLLQQTFFRLLHVTDERTVDPLLKDTQDAVVQRIQIRKLGSHISGRMNSGVSVCSNVLMSGARCDFPSGRQCVMSMCDLIDANITSPGKGCT